MIDILLKRRKPHPKQKGSLAASLNTFPVIPIIPTALPSLIHYFLPKK
jgi:hypothetical protein